MEITRKDNKRGTTWTIENEFRVVTTKNDKQEKAGTSSVYITPLNFAKKPTYIKSIPDEDIDIFVGRILDKIEYALEFGGNPKEITKKIREEYQNSEHLEKEVIDIKTEFKELKKEFDVVTKKMNEICRKMEML